MINHDRIPAFVQYLDEFDTSSDTIKMKPTISKEAIQAYFREEADSLEDKSILEDAEKLSDFMIQKFKESEIYPLKSKTEQEEIIEYLKNNPDIKEKIYDEDGNKFTIYT